VTRIDQRGRRAGFPNFVQDMYTHTPQLVSVDQQSRNRIGWTPKQTIESMLAYIKLKNLEHCRYSLKYAS